MPFSVNATRWRAVGAQARHRRASSMVGGRACAPVRDDRRRSALQVVAGFQTARAKSASASSSVRPVERAEVAAGRDGRRRRPTASRVLAGPAMAAQATMAKSPCRRANSWKAWPVPGAAQGKCTASISSSSSRAVDISPLKNSSAGSRRARRSQTTVRSRRRARSATAEFPRSDRPAPPSRRPCRARGSGHGRSRACASASSGWCCASSGQSSSAAWRTRRADTDRAVPATAMPSSPGTCMMSISTRRPRHPHRQQRHQRLAAGHDRGLGAVRPQAPRAPRRALSARR